MLPLDAELAVGAPKMLGPPPSDFAVAGDPNMVLPEEELAAEAPKMLKVPVLGVGAAELPSDFTNMLVLEAELAVGAPTTLEPPISSFDVAGDSNMLWPEAELGAETPKILEPLVPPPAPISKRPPELAAGTPNKTAIPPETADEPVGLTDVLKMSVEAPQSVLAIAGDAIVLPLETRLAVGAPKMLGPLPSDFATAGDPNMLLLDAESTVAAPKMPTPPGFDVAGDASML